MSQQDHTPVVPLEAGAGPNNPPCPACGEPLFGWLSLQPGLAGPVRRCESCGLGVIGERGSTEEALRGLERLAAGEGMRIANRASVACSLGGAGWAGLEPGGRYLYTVEAVRRLLATRDQVVASARWAPRAGLAGMWQTILNSLTFGRNIALGALGKSEPVNASRRWQRRIDGLISVVLAIPALVLALPLELSAAVVGRGAAIKVRYQLL
ncbi:MAG TPA: hypothetical protein VG518_07200 [Solirubrobacterales bacterium]|nr:hypothetical protein [Solirubrobacterales bacterium]